MQESYDILGTGFLPPTLPAFYCLDSSPYGSTMVIAVPVQSPQGGSNGSHSETPTGSHGLGQIGLSLGYLLTPEPISVAEDEIC